MTTTPTPVSKPPNAGAAQTALALTKQAYANIRSGPGLSYADLGDLKKYAPVSYYPLSRTADGWVWIESFDGAGWVSMSVVSFELVVTPPPLTPQQVTPYRNGVAVWHWRGDSVSENSIEELARNLKASAPHVTQVWVKTSDYTRAAGAQWMGYWDSKRALAIDGVNSIARWVSVLAAQKLEFHAWCVPRGADVNAEAQLIIQACKVPGVKSMILDVEPYAGFWLGGRDAVRALMVRVRRALPAAFHIGICIDPRQQWYESIYPREWQPFVNSVHPMDYWDTMRRTPEDILEETYRVWGGYGKPIIPILEGNSTVDSMKAAHTLATLRHHAQGLSWWRLGVIGPVEWQAVNQPIRLGAPPEEDTVYGDEQVVKPAETGFARFSYTGREEFLEFQGTWGWRVFYKATEPQTSKTVARWTPRLTVSDKYEVAVFVPARHATTRNARYKLHGVRGTGTELVVSVDQSIYRNQWVTLGVFDLDKNASNAGVVYLNDLTGETGREIAFDAVRWRRVIQSGGGGTGTPTGFADGYDAPIGTAAERRSASVWPGQWLDASPFGRLYLIGTANEAYHTGADLNLPRDADANATVYAAADGIVTFAAALPIWGYVIVIRHDPLVGSNLIMYSRSAHLATIGVEAGRRVKRGQAIGTVGNAFGRWAFHLHFDLSPTTILETNPGHWPAKNREALLNNYVDPRDFITNNRPK
jgi:murein DD-endopeptidase MepM/ murein hydrolase activator NlpD